MEGNQNQVSLSQKEFYELRYSTLEQAILSVKTIAMKDTGSDNTFVTDEE